MLHDQELLDRLTAFAPVVFDGEVFRATRRGRDPLATSVAGGRWMAPNQTPTLYTSCERDGALAEIVHHWHQLTPLPSKPVIVHTLSAHLRKSLRLGRAELSGLDVDFGSPTPGRTQEIGAAVAYLEYDGLIAPSLRWVCDNVIVFGSILERRSNDFIVRSSEEVDWRQWMRDHGGVC
jgi:hypothetical protein